MANIYSRKQRVAQEIKKKINISLQCDIRDPRLSRVSVSWVKVSRDLGSAIVFVIFNDLHNYNHTSPEVKKGIQILQAASGFIRYLLGKTMHLRIVPQLTFTYDQSLYHGMYIHNLVNQIMQEHHNKDHIIN